MILDSSCKKFTISFLLFISIFIISISCDSTDPPTPTETKATLTLAHEDTSCTEAWLQLKTKDLTLPAELTLKQYNQTGDSISQIFVLNTQDSLLYIDSLLPNQNYKFKVAANTTNNPQPTTNEVLVQTMDTTSHNFTWQTFTFGDLGSSKLYDVTIINENDIWAVGEILIADSVGTGYTVYNAVHWDGQSWKLKKIQALYLGNWVTPPLEGIFAFSSTDIWLAGSLPIHGDGTNWTVYDIRETVDPNLSVSRLWGSNPNNIYFVGRAGSIVHYNGYSFSKIESGTTVVFQDINGAKNQKTGEHEILAVCNQNYPHYTAIYTITNNTANQISLPPIQEQDLISCWFIPDKHYYVVGSGIYEKNRLSEGNWRNNPLDITHYEIYGINGSDINNILVAGAFGEVIHFNGYSWKSYLPELGLFDGSNGQIDIYDKLVAIIGYEGIKAKITIGHRN